MKTWENDASATVVSEDISENDVQELVHVKVVLLFMITILKTNKGDNSDIK